MCEVLFACDLDNTLIHSYKWRREGDICVEWLKEKAQGYMDPADARLLPVLFRRATVVPVTTRSMAQYRRIQWPEGQGPECAVTTNGAMLLRDDVQDDAWLRQSEALARPYAGEMRTLLAALEADGDYIRCRLVDDMYLFAYCRDGVDPKAKAAALEGRTTLETLVSGRKLYFFPTPFDKGRALERLRALFMPKLVIAAGDSVIDVPMLRAADVALCRESVFGVVENGGKRLLEEGKSLIEIVLEIIDARR
ncbi:MAG: haloacid dehalogenase [Clostridiales bacterium]|nr:haloacid dehalogenase [Clostridiales bacterium]